MQHRFAFRFRRVHVALAVCLGLAASHPARANDHMFPAAPTARASIDFDSHGFLINGKRTFLVSAGMEYARVPRALWRDRLLRLKRAGFNCVEMYNFWDWHEPQKGKFDFSGDHDLDAYLKLVHQMGMYAICRVGPYYCAEWDLGGYPVWLHLKPGMKVRTDDPQFEAAVDGYFDKLIPIVAANQINHGGSVILVQLENEHPAGWGTEMPNPYFTHLREKALSLGLQVPYFFSGLHHGSDPGKDTAMDDPARPNPWFSTEFWSVWYDHYGPKPGDAATYARRTWKIIAHGGNGYNYYMAHGGSNFGYTNNNEDAASYDYGAAVGQAGDLRPIYYTFKRAAWFARSFQDILEDSTDATSAVQGRASNSAIRVTARQGAAGMLLFLDNPGKESVQTQVSAPLGDGLPTSGALTLAPGEIMPMVQDFALTPDITLQWAPTRILGIVPQGNTTTLVIYGPAGSPAELHFTVPAATRIAPGAAGLTAPTATTLALNTQFSAGSPAEYAFTVGTRRVRILAVSDALADRTWFVDAGRQNDIVVGPAFVADATSGGGSPRLTVERPWQDTSDLPTLVYGPTGAPTRLTPIPTRQPFYVIPLALGAWQVRSGMAAAASDYDDRAWLASDEPQQMGADGDLTCDAWYRAVITVPTAGQYALHAAGAGDRAMAYVDGTPAGGGRLHGDDLLLTLPAGRHTLAVFTAHDGRNKEVNFTGVLFGADPKGLMGPVTLTNGAGSSVTVTGWKLHGGPGDPLSATGWKPLSAVGDLGLTFPGPTFYRTSFPAAPPAAVGPHPIWRVITTGLGHGSVWVNGHNLGRYPEKIPINGLYVPECWLVPDANSLVIYDEDGKRPDQVRVIAEAAASRDVVALVPAK